MMYKTFPKFLTHKKIIGTFLPVVIVFIILTCGTRCQQSPESQFGESRTLEADRRTHPIQDIKVLLLMGRNWGVGYFMNRDVFEHYGWRITVAGSSDSLPPCPYSSEFGVGPMIPDLLISQVEDVSEYEAVVIVPASQFANSDPYSDFLDSPETLGLIKSAAEKEIPILTICSGVRVLAAAGVIDGKRVVGEPKYQQEYEASGAIFVGKDHPPVIDGCIVTGARDMYYNLQNCEALASALEERKFSRGQKSSQSRKFISEGNGEFSAPGLDWARTYKGMAADGGESFCETHDGGFLIVGYTFSAGRGDADLLAVKTDPKGKIAWARAYGGVGVEYGYNCMATADGYIIVGYTTSFGAGSRDVYLIKINEKGKEVWVQTYGGPSRDVGASVCPAPEGGFYVVGSTQSFGAGEEDVYLIKTDAEGNEIWSRTFGGERSEIGNSVTTAEGGGCLIGASTGTFGKGNNDFYLIRTDAQGREIWTKSFGTKGRRSYGYDWCSAVRATASGGYILAGSTDCRDILDVHAVKTDARGEEIWASSAGRKPFYDYGNAVAECADGYIIAGATKSVDNNNDVYLVKLNIRGEVAWEKTIGGLGSDWASAVLTTSDGSIIVLGQTASSTLGICDVFLLKITP